jgi:hypothetical protein
VNRERSAVEALKKATEGAPRSLVTMRRAPKVMLPDQGVRSAIRGVTLWLIVLVNCSLPSKANYRSIPTPSLSQLSSNHHQTAPMIRGHKSHHHPRRGNASPGMLNSCDGPTQAIVFSPQLTAIVKLSLRICVLSNQHLQSAPSPAQLSFFVIDRRAERRRWRCWGPGRD